MHMSVIGRASGGDGDDDADITTVSHCFREKHFHFKIVKYIPAEKANSHRKLAKWVFL